MLDFERYHDRVWTPADLAELPEDVDWRRFEIVDGVLIVSPQPITRHDLVVMELGVALRPVIPVGFRVIGSAGIEMGRSYRVPDVTVLAESVFRTHQYAVSPQDVLLAVEIESPSSITTDRITKPAQYAAAAIPYFWRVETAPLRLVAYRLVDGVYVELGSWGTIAHIRDPFELDIDLSELLPPTT